MLGDFRGVQAEVLASEFISFFELLLLLFHRVVNSMKIRLQLYSFRRRFSS